MTQEKNSVDWFNSNSRMLFVFISISKISITLFTIFQHYQTDVPRAFALCTGDCMSYLAPIENFVNHGQYSPDFRMPGYGILYLPLYMLFSQLIAVNMLVVIQLIGDILASWLFVKIIWLLTQNKNITLLGLLFYGIGCTITVYNKYIITESVSASLLVFSFYFLVKNRKGENKTDFALASLFIVWAYFCRPVFFPLFLIQSFYIIFLSIKTSNYKNGVWFFLPFLVIQGLWTTRNYVQKSKLYLLTESNYYSFYSSSQLASWEFVKTFDDFKAPYFFPDADFKNRSSQIINIDSVSFPSGIYTRDFNKDSLMELRNIGKLLTYQNMPDSTRQHYNIIFTEKILRYTRSVKSNHFFLVYVKTPLIRLYNHTLKSSGVQFLFTKEFSSLTFLQKLVKLFFVLIYKVALFGAIFFLLKLLLTIQNPVNYLIGICCLYAFTVHPLFIGCSDVRYLYSFYPLIALCSTLFFYELQKKYKNY